jgi:NitT/TauT family transport system permease protein
VNDTRLTISRTPPRAHPAKPDRISSPTAIAVRLAGWLPTEIFWRHVGVTLLETIVGFVGGTLGGVVLGIALGLNRRVAEVFDPYILAIYSLPKVALAPLLILWFGIGLASKFFLAMIGVFFLVFYNTFAGTISTDQELVDVLRLMGAGRAQIIAKVILPSAMFWIFTGLKVSVPFALIGAVVGEIMASNRGLGYLIEASAGQFDTAGVFAGLIVLMVISTGIQSVVSWAERSMLHWQESGAAKRG